MRYRIAAPSQYLIITGCCIEDVKLAKKGWIFPFQSCRVFDISPENYTFDVQAMSIEMLPFTLPAVFTIGPKDEIKELKIFAKLVADRDMSSSHVRDLIKGIVEGETRVLAAGMSMLQVFQGTRDFKKEVFDKVQLELDQFGLHIYNANIKQLVDIEGHEYFSYLGQKTQQEAANQAKVDVAKAKYKGDTGEKEQQGLTLCNAAKVDAETSVYAKNREAEARQKELKLDAQTKIFENSREAEIAEANANLAMRKSEWLQQSKIAEIVSHRAASIRDAELRKELEQKEALAETERLRSQALTKATVDYEVKVQGTNSEVYKLQKDADVSLYGRRAEAEAIKTEAEAFLYRQQKEADGFLYYKGKEAEGVRVLGEAHASYVSRMLEAFRGNTSALHDYMLIEKKVYQEMGTINAEAIKGLQPKLCVWNTGSGDGPSGGSAAAQPVADIYRMIPPLLSTIRDQTSIPDGAMPPVNIFTRT